MTVRAYRLAAWVLLPILLILYGLQLREAQQNAGQRIGVTMVQRGAGLALTAVVPDSPAHSAGVRAGDLLIAIDGVAVPDEATYDEIAADFSRDRPLALSLTREGVPLALSVTPGVAVGWSVRILNGFALLLMLGIAFLTLQRLDDLRGRLLFALSIAFAFTLARPEGVASSGAWYHLNLAFAFFLIGVRMALMLHLALLIPGRPRWLQRQSWVVPGLYAFALGLGVGLGLAALATGVFGIGLPLQVTTLDALVHRLVLPLWGLLVIGVLGLAALRHPGSEGRIQAGVVLFGTLPLFVLTVVGAVRGDSIARPASGFEAMAALLLLLTFTAAIARQRPFNLELVVRRGLTYAIQTSALVLAYAGMMVVGGALLPRMMNVDERALGWYSSVATLLIGLLFLPVRHTVQNLIDRRIFPERQQRRERLAALIAELPALGDLNAMGQRLVAELRTIFASRFCVLLLTNPDSDTLMSTASAWDPRDLERPRSVPQLILPPNDAGLVLLRKAARPLPFKQVLRASRRTFGPRLQGMGASLMVPLVSREKLTGLLIFGAYEAGQSHAPEELEVLTFLAGNVAAMFENVRLFTSATYEGLTGQLRREAILSYLEKETQRALRHDRPLAVAVADLDHFKSINDRYGHLTGDAVLKDVAEALSGALRANDALGRYGGEEFLLVFPETDLQAAIMLADKLRLRVAGLRVPLEDGGTLQVRCSIGVSSLASLTAAEEDNAPRALIGKADEALYRAKENGRNRVEAHTGVEPPMIQSA
ncbi:MAG: diguanylate cyclase [Acidobacteriota bacterium]